MSTVYVSIGNSDGKLSDEQWREYRALVHALLTDIGPKTGAVQSVHGSWESFNPEYINACWCIEVSPGREDGLKATLRDLARNFEQDSIAWATAETEFLAGSLSS